jgi:hypothetical protein
MFGQRAQGLLANLQGSASMKSISAAIIALAGVISFSVGALIPAPGPSIAFSENGITLFGPPPMLTTGGILMTVGALLAVIGVIAWIRMLRREGADAR